MMKYIRFFLMIFCMAAVFPPGAVYAAEIEVPDLSGKTQYESDVALSNAGLVLGTVTEEDSTTVPSGQVIRQSVSPGSSVESGTRIDVVISSGIPVTPTPEPTPSPEPAPTLEPALEPTAVPEPSPEPVPEIIPDSEQDVNQESMEEYEEPFLENVLSEEETAYYEALVTNSEYTAALLLVLVGFEILRIVKSWTLIARGGKE